jgi:DNA-binding NtrC family response regulator
LKKGRILIVDDDVAAAELAALSLEFAHFATERAQSGAEALRCIEREPPLLVVSDLCMPEMSGIELLSRIRERWPALPVILATVETDVDTAVDAVIRGASNYLVKPVAPAALVAAVSKAVARMTPPEIAPDDPDASAIVGHCASIVEVRHLVALAARSDVNVLVVGETGVGKELVARAVHGFRRGGTRPFAAHNCATTPPDLFDAEFFGHTRGAFTGAYRERLGLLREADGGTLFLDELECLSLASQAKLLRVLDDGEFRPVGAPRLVSVAVRFVAATNRTPESLLASGELREDLYYRLRGFEIRVPPLRERLDDLPLLAQHFLRQSGKYLTAESVRALQSSSWPGNVRQLRSVLECAVVRARAISIEAEDLDLHVPVTTPSAPVTSASPRLAPAPHSTLAALERDAIVRALAAHGGNRSHAARALGIHRSTLLRRIRELKIS